MVEKIDLASCRSDKEGGKVMIHRTAATSEEAVTAAKEAMSKWDLKGTIGGFYRKRGEGENSPPDVKGIYGQKETSFSFTDVDGALAFSMAGALAAAALAF